MSSREKLNLDMLENVSGGDLLEESEALKNMVPPHIHEFYPISKDAHGIRTDKCCICGALKYFTPDGDEISEWEHNLRK